MLTMRPAAERGYTELDWLKSHHTFSFDQFSDPDYRHFGPLRIINEDYVAPGAGFGMHSHRDMEIITYVIAGEAQHRDSLGTGSVIKAGEIQKMSAGSGILHVSVPHRTW
jgi:redox-sensitive bicupin YhaK (pirin superfamily)